MHSSDVPLSTKLGWTEEASDEPAFAASDAVKNMREIKEGEEEEARDLQRESLMICPPSRMDVSMDDRIRGGVIFDLVLDVNKKKHYDSKGL